MPHGSITLTHTQTIPGIADHLTSEDPQSLVPLPGRGRHEFPHLKAMVATPLLSHLPANLEHLGRHAVSLDPAWPSTLGFRFPRIPGVASASRRGAALATAWEKLAPLYAVLHNCLPGPGGREKWFEFSQRARESIM